jgi:hypothetical protein
MTVAVVEPCPAHLADEEQPEYGGHLFFNLEDGRAGCGNPECGWSGIATSVDHVISTRCPACEHPPDHDAARVPRNQRCPCGSGVKAKRCDCEGYTV